MNRQNILYIYRNMSSCVPLTYSILSVGLNTTYDVNNCLDVLIVVNREKRSGISDQRLAELETLLELKRLRENLRTRTPVAYGLIDPAKIGRRRKRDHYFKTNYFDKLLTRDKLAKTVIPVTGFNDYDQ
ncbi:unnamed protein product [Oppiella nova]|uniref:Uncharacterized protein n=1 Tax=Oppiella nova TaxID=334625 RepID=A0A7R9QKC6_9ACAR|nr:unnamed protein product [Oppiella nova]CAG2167045.1 unnamed protein product [Oppiella nova]